MGVDFKDVQQGFASAAGPLTQELLLHDSHAIEPALQDKGNFLAPFEKIPFSRYYDPEFAKLEMEVIWKKSWQVAGRDEDIPEIGDRKLYEVGGLSYIIIHSGENEFHALQNSCMHRGTRLCNGNTSAKSIKCPFHAWEWNNDGTLKNIPSRWDFPSVTDADYGLPQAKVARWGGFIFINPDLEAGPLEDALGVLPKHFTARETEDRFTFVGFRKKLRCNWKIAQEAFFEAYHVIETHSNIMNYNGDTQTSYDVWDDGKSQVSRSITPSAIPSGHLGDDASRLVAAQEALKTFALPFPGIELPEINSGDTGRAEVAEWRRQTLGAGLGVDFSTASDSNMLDASQYFMFPNFWPWWGEGLPLIYVFTPGTNPEECLLEARLTLPVSPHGPRPPAAELIEMDFDTPCSSVPALGMMASVFDQDFTNLPQIQIGLRSVKDGGFATFGRYQESRIQAFHNLLERKIAEYTSK